MMEMGEDIFLNEKENINPIPSFRNLPAKRIQKG